jgi:hypothetical protein
MGLGSSGNSRKSLKLRKRGTGEFPSPRVAGAPVMPVSFLHIRGPGRLGYGRASRILDMMQRDGIIGPPDGSKPRDVLKRPDWLREVEDQLK